MAVIERIDLCDLHKFASENRGDGAALSSQFQSAVYNIIDRCNKHLSQGRSIMFIGKMGTTHEIEKIMDYSTRGIIRGLRTPKATAKIVEVDLSQVQTISICA